jgi:hypothetical protein
MNKKSTDSYIEMCLHLDGKENVYLRIPTVWDDVRKIWHAFIKTPITHKLIHANGKNSFSLQNAMNAEISAIFDKQDELAKEVFEMFMPAFYWKEN